MNAKDLSCLRPPFPLCLRSVVFALVMIVTRCETRLLNLGNAGWKMGGVVVHFVDVVINNGVVDGDFATVDVDLDAAPCNNGSVDGRLDDVSVNNWTVCDRLGDVRGLFAAVSSNNCNVSGRLDDVTTCLGDVSSRYFTVSIFKTNYLG
jgi:hypothetical protein